MRSPKRTICCFGEVKPLNLLTLTQGSAILSGTQSLIENWRPGLVCVVAVVCPLDLKQLAPAGCSPWIISCWLWFWRFSSLILQEINKVSNRASQFCVSFRNFITLFYIHIYTAFRTNTVCFIWHIFPIQRNKLTDTCVLDKKNFATGARLKQPLYVCIGQLFGWEIYFPLLSVWVIDSSRKE